MVQFTAMDEQIAVAGCVLLDDYDRILLMHRSHGDGGLWYLPGGKVEDEELPEVAAVREINEELGVHVALVKALGNAAFEHDGDEYLFYWFQARLLKGEIRIMEPGLFDDFDYFELEDMPSLALSAASEILETKLISGEFVLD